MFCSCVLHKVLYSLHRQKSSSIISGRFCDKTAIVTASTQGIGFAIAKRLACEGARVIVSSRKQKNVDSAISKLKAEGLKVCGLVCHVAKAEDRKQLFAEAERLGGLNILVSNVGVNPALAPLLNTDESMWDKLFDINVKASFLLAKEALPLLRKKQNGKIIFVSSIAGLQPHKSFEDLGVYCASKTALIGTCKAAALQLAKENITVNCVAPGIIQTKFSKALIDSKKKMDDMLAQIPMGRLGVPEDISSAVAFLASEDANYITGETIVIAGGMLSRL